jgi:hypothetical protein
MCFICADLSSGFINLYDAEILLVEHAGSITEAHLKNVRKALSDMRKQEEMAIESVKTPTDSKYYDDYVNFFTDDA